MYSRLELLAHSGVDLTLLLLSARSASFGFDQYVEDQPEVWARVRSWCSGQHRLELPAAVVRPRRSRGRHAVSLFRDPARELFPVANEDNGVTAEFRHIVRQVQPDLIWAENLVPAVLADRSRSGVPIIYGHHDWIWRVIGLNQGKRGRTWGFKITSRLLKGVEESLVRRVRACVTSSAHEAAQVRGLSSGLAAHFPLTYDPVALAGVEIEPCNTVPLNTTSSSARVVHLGGMKTVANRIGLERFVDVVQPSLSASDGTAELWVVGSLDGIPDTLVPKLRQTGITCTGFVPDLGSVLRPHDVQVVPWEHATGYRSRIPLLLNYAQVVVSTRAAVTGLPELSSGENCVLVEDLEEMGPAVLELLAAEPRRRKLGCAARATSLEHFTREAVQPRFDRFLAELR